MPHSVPCTLQQATADPCLGQRLLDTQGKSGSVSCGVTGPFSWILVKALFVPSKGLFPQSCVSSGSSVVGLMVTSSKRAYATPRSAAPRAPALFGRPFLTYTSAEDTQTFKGRPGSVSVGSPGAYKVLFEPSKHL